MPFTVILHIGLPKTGATTLQQAFFENRDRLAEEGIACPLPTNSHRNAQHDFVRAFLHGPDSVNTLFDECRRQIEGSDRLPVSSEEFAAWRGVKIQSTIAFPRRAMAFTCASGVGRFPRSGTGT